MKKNYFILSLLVFLFNSALAQKFNAGFSLGLCATDISGAGTRDGDSDFHKIGFTAGGLINTPINKKNVFQFEINFIQKGSSQPPDSNNNGYYKIALAYVEVPLLVKRHVTFTLKKKPVNKVDLEAGASIGRMISRTVVGNTNYNIATPDKLFNRTDISILLGADYNFTKNVYFCFRYSNSIIPAIKRNTPNLNFITYTFNRGNNMVFQFSFKFVFGGVKDETSTKE